MTGAEIVDFGAGLVWLGPQAKLLNSKMFI